MRGGTDFLDSPADCKTQARLGQNEEKGEAVTKITMLEKYTPAIGSSKPGLKIIDMQVEGLQAPGEELSRKIQF